MQSPLAIEVDVEATTKVQCSPLKPTMLIKHGRKQKGSRIDASVSCMFSESMKNTEHVYVVLDMWYHIVATFFDNKKALAYAEVLRRESPDSCFTVEEHPVLG